MSLLINNNYGKVTHIENSVVNVNPLGEIDIKRKTKDISVQKKERESAPFEPVTATFTKKRTQTYNIVALYQDLIKEGWIEEGNPDDFCALFEGEPSECRIVWTKKVGKDNLYALFKMMVDNNFITVPSGFGLQRIVESHFVYKNGEYVTGIDSGKPSDSARSMITNWRKLLETKVNFDE